MMAWPGIKFRLKNKAVSTFAVGMSHSSLFMLNGLYLWEKVLFSLANNRNSKFCSVRPIRHSQEIEPALIMREDTEAITLVDFEINKFKLLSDSTTSNRTKGREKTVVDISTRIPWTCRILKHKPMRRLRPKQKEPK